MSTNWLAEQISNVLGLGELSGNITPLRMSIERAWFRTGTQDVKEQIIPYVETLSTRIQVERHLQASPVHVPTTWDLTDCPLFFVCRNFAVLLPLSMSTLIAGSLFDNLLPPLLPRTQQALECQARPLLKLSQASSRNRRRTTLNFLLPLLPVRSPKTHLFPLQKTSQGRSGEPLGKSISRVGRKI
jgi:hypothetical protein